MQAPRWKSAAKSLKLLVTARWTPEDGTAKRYPKVVQMPMTYRCNAKCVMCNIWKMDWSNEVTLEEFEKHLSDPLFKEVRALGINGGEPSLVKQLPRYAEIILRLPKLQSLNIISHGFNRKLLLPALKEIYALCRQKGVHFHVSISLDGYGAVHEQVRGLRVFPLVEATLETIKNEKSKYCDTLDLGCTVVQHNVEHLQELDVYARLRQYDIKYRLGIDNKRIESQKLHDQFSVLYDATYQTATEFFHSRYFKAKPLYEKFKYFSIYHWLATPPARRRRLLGCDWKENGVTIDSRGDIYYCAVASDKIGSLRQTTGESAFFKPENLTYRTQIIQNECDNCIHDYHGKPEFKNVWFFLRKHFNESYYWIAYYFKAKFA
ncbi:MAG: radical SAM protein [Sphingobacteriales bacterium]|nr:radical SAM protein [Sphingobacteriales bacterium]